MGEKTRASAAAGNRTICAGAATTASQIRQESFSRIWRITLNRPGT